MKKEQVVGTTIVRITCSIHLDNVNDLDINYKGYIRGFCVDILKYF